MSARFAGGRPGWVRASLNAIRNVIYLVIIRDTNVSERWRFPGPGFPQKGYIRYAFHYAPGPPIPGRRLLLALAFGCFAVEAPLASLTCDRVLAPKRNFGKVPMDTFRRNHN